MALYPNGQNGSTPPNKWAARALDKKYFFKKKSPEQLVRIQNNFTEMFLIMPFAIIAQMDPLHKTRWPPEL